MSCLEGIGYACIKAVTESGEYQLSQHGVSGGTAAYRYGLCGCNGLVSQPEAKDCFLYDLHPGLMSDHTERYYQLAIWQSAINIAADSQFDFRVQYSSGYLGTVSPCC